MPEIKPQVTLHTERPVVRKDIPTTFDIVVEINSSTDTQSVSFESKPCNLCLVIDRSGSMSGGKLDIAKQACLDIYKRLDFQKDRLSVVVFNHTAEVIFNPDIPNKQFEEKIQKIRTGGNTDLASGWRLGLLEIQTHGSEEHINRVILLTDGQANQGETKKDVLARDSEQAYNLGIITSTIGIGQDFEEDLLDAIATASCGNFWFVEETSLETIIKTEFEGALSILHENPQIRLDLPSGVSIDKQLNKLRKASRSDVEFRLPPLWGGKRTCYAFRLNIEPNLFESTENEFLNMGTTLLDKGVEISSTVQELQLGNEEDFVTANQNGVVIKEIANYQVTESEEKAIELIDGGDIQGLQDLVIQMRDGIRIAQSQAVLEAEEKRKMEREKVRLERLEKTISIINEVSGKDGISNKLQQKFQNEYSSLISQIVEGNMNRLRKRMFKNKNIGRLQNFRSKGLEDEMLEDSENQTLYSLSNIFEELAEIDPEDPEIRKLQEKINERLERKS